MSTPTAVANAELAKVLSGNEDYVLSVTKSKAVDLSEKMFQSCLISDSMMDQFSSLDHSRVEPQLQLRYLFRLVNQRIQQDESVGDRFLGLLESWGEQPLCEYLKRNTSGEEEPEIKRIRLDDHLCSDNISWILEVLVDASHKYEALAIALGLRTYQRHNIEGNDNLDKLTKVLDIWLSGGSTKPPTINTLRDALSSKTVGQGRIALELEERYKATLNTKASNIIVHGNSNLPFSIVKQSPCRVEVEDNKSTLLMVQASHTENTSFQWNKNGQALAETISSDQPCYFGIHEHMLFINHAHQGTQGEYTCCVSNEERQVVSNKVTLTVLYTPEKKILLNKYSSINTQVPLDEAWPPVGAETFIRLILVESSGTATGPSVYSVEWNLDKMLVRNKQINFRDVLTAYKSASLLLIEGHPGSGKTTLVCKLIKDWVEGTVLAQAKLVFLVSLRTLNDDHLQTTLSELLQQFYSSCGTLQAVVLDIERNNGEGVCFVFDGLDEYHPNRVDESVVFKILHRRYLSQAMIIVSSRPGAMARLRQEIVTQHLEVLGFTENQIFEYIDKFPFDSSLEPSQLKEYLRLHPNVLHMCYLPIHAAIICFVYNIKRGHLPHTQTKIYEEFTKSMLLRHLKCNKSEVQIHSLKELPDDIREYFNMLCLLAFEMTAELKQVIDSKEIIFPLSRDTSFHGDWSLGLVTCNRTAKLCGISTSYMFLHLTLQEFLAAYYITSAEEEKKYQLIERLLSKSVHDFESVWTFCFGLETFQSQEMLDIYREILEPDEDRMVTPVICAFESQQSIVCDEVMRLSEGKIIILDMIPFEVPAFKFIIKKTTQAIKTIELVWGPGDELLEELLEHIKQVKFSELETLSLNGVSANTSTHQNVSKILEYCRDLQHLKLGLYGFTNEVGEILVDSMRQVNQLTCLKLTNLSSLSSGQSRGILTVIKKIRCLTQLKVFGLSGWKIDQQFLEVLANNLCHLPSMERLDLSYNIIDLEGAISLASACYLTGLKYLDLAGNDFCLSNAIILAFALHHLTRLESLDLGSNGICSEGVFSLASALRHLIRLERLSLSLNTIGSEGARCLASTLQHLTELEYLSLSENGIDVHSAIQVITALKDSQKLKRVLLNKNRAYSFSSRDGFHLQGLVTSDDSATIGSLVSAAKLHKRDIDLHLGFKTINIQHSLHSSM